MLKLVKSTFYKEEPTKQKIAKFLLRAKHLSFGKQCEKFEKRFALFQKRKYCIFVNSGSSANLALIQAFLNLKRLSSGDRVGFSSLTWSTNIMPIIQLGLRPVPIDIELDTLNVSSKMLLKTLQTTKLKALFLTNVLGLCDDIDVIKKICQKEKILLFEDNCESLGTIYKKVKLGSFGIASTFSYYVGHHLSTIEGGSICTDDEELATMLRIVRAHGWDRNLDFAKRKEIRRKFKVNSTFYSRYMFYDLGYNLRPTEINGFIGNIQLEYVDEIIRKRQKNFIKIYKYISTSGRYLPLRYEHIDVFSSFAIPLICKSREIKEMLVKKCSGKVEIRPIVGGDITQQPFYAKHFSVNQNSTSNASIVHEQGLYFGNDPNLTNSEIKQLINILRT